MKLVIRENQELPQPRVTVEYAILDGEVESIVRTLNSVGKELLGKRAGELVRIAADEVLYCELVDGLTFIYTPEDVIESLHRLSEIDAKMRTASFIRISRSMIANLDHVKTLRPFPGARLQLQMDNGEYVVVSRQYAGDVKKRIGL